MNNHTTVPDRFTAIDGALWIRKFIGYTNPFVTYKDGKEDSTEKPRKANEEEALKAYLSTIDTVTTPTSVALTLEKPAVMPFKDDSRRSNKSLFPDMHNDVIAEMEKKPDVEQPQVMQPQQGETQKNSEWLTSLLERERFLSDAATKPVVFSPALIKRGETDIVGRGTINIIQGAYGSHKSRLAELFASMMLTNDPEDPKFLGFQRKMQEEFCVCYIDTERNQNEELPFAIQGIKMRAGYAIEEQPKDFRFTSIKAVDRSHRFDAIEGFLKHVRAETPLHLFCLIDVVTDAIGDFNDSKESMKLFDFLGNLCDYYGATFLLVIHQNPGTEKARGHTGTEAANKASTALQIGLERDSNGKETDLIRLRYLKLRRGKRPDPVFLQYSKEANGLVLADDQLMTSHLSQRKHKADMEDIADRLVSLLSMGSMLKNEVWTVLENEFKAKNATIRERLKTIVEEQPTMYNESGLPVRLADFKDGREQYFHLVPKV